MNQVICYQLVSVGEEHGLVLKTSESKEKIPAMTELKKWADSNGWSLVLSEGGDGDCIIQEIVA